MPLIDLKTDLKSLKYGRDRLGGGSSGQPYIQTNINRPGANLIGNFDDGLVRGGAVGAAKASIVDTLRIGRFLTDFPKGPLFIVKQVGLQLSNPRLEAKQLKTDNPTSGGGLLRNVGNFIANIANKITNIVGPTRLYNLGINTIAQVPVNAFGRHFNRHGLLPVQDDQTKYLAVAQFNNEGVGAPDNRLVGLKNRFRLGIVDSSILKNQTFLRRKELKSIMSAGSTSAILLKADEIQAGKIADYIGGPHSVYGIGRTLIKRTPEHTNDNPNLTLAKNRSFNKQHLPEVKIQNTFDFSVSTTTKSLLNKNEYQSPAKKLPTDNTSFLNYVASDSDKHSTNTTKQAISYTSASRNIENFLGVSENSSSKYGLETFSVLSKVPATLDEKGPLQYALNSVSASHAVSASKDLGLSKLDSEIPTESISKENNVIIYTPGNSTLKKYAELRKKVDGQAVGSIFKYNENKNTSLGSTSTIDDYNGIVNAYTTNPLSYNNGIDEPFVVSGTFATLNREFRVGSGRKDSLNLTPIFSTVAGTIGDVPPMTIPNTDAQTINDLVKFRIQAIDGDNPSLADYMIFRAYITQYSDNTDATWNSVKYAGRGEDFYIYNGFSRKIQIGFKVAALSAEEMKPMYQKLNFLMGNLMPDYKDNLMRGPLVKMTVGNWIDGQDGILTSVGYTIPQDSPWEIGLGDQQLILPHIVEVSLAFTPIGSQTKGQNLISSKSQVISHIAQNANADVNYIGG